MRSAVRFPLHLPVSVATEREQIRAQTSDISAGGLLFYSEAALVPDSSIEFTISLPAGVLGTPGDVRVQCRGRVVRCLTQDDGRHAIAAVIDEYRIERA